MQTALSVITKLENKQDSVASRAVLLESGSSIFSLLRLVFATSIEINRFFIAGNCRGYFSRCQDIRIYVQLVPKYRFVSS